MADNDFYAACIEEIALEGLDGITLQALWIRLALRPKFPLPLDDRSKAFIWRSIVPDARLELYELAAPRPDLVVYDRYKHVDPDVGYVIEPSELPPDPYPVVLVNKDGQRGSCSTFDSRLKVSDAVRESKPTLEEVAKRWGNSLVIVADQATRERALLGPCNSARDLDLTDIKYAMLERIGRSRYMGQTTQGRQDMKVFQLTNASMFIMRKQLFLLNLITKQKYYQRGKNQQSCTGFLLHLPRFFVEVQTKSKMMTRELCSLLATKPLKREVYYKVRAEMGLTDGLFKRLMNSAALPYVTQYTMAYNEMYPDSPEEDWYTKNMSMKILRIVELTKPFEKGEGEGEEEDGEEAEGRSSAAVFFNPCKYVYDLPRLDQGYEELRRAGTNGATLIELAQRMSTTRLEARSLLKGLVLRHLAVPYREDVGRQRVARYFCPEFASQSETHKKVAAERKRMLEQSSESPPAKKQKVSPVEKSPQAEPLEAKRAPVSGEKDEHILSEECDQPTITVEANDEPLFRKVKGRGADVNFPSTSDMEGRQSLQELIPSYKMLMRANKIIDYVKTEKLVADLTKLLKALQKHEEEEGYKLKLDRVSLERLLYKLCKSGYLKSIRTTLRLGSKEKKLQLICHPDVTKDDELVRSTIEQAKFRYFAIHKENKKPQAPRSPKSPELTECSKMEYNPSMGRFYGSQPKFRRMQLCYSFMHYMLYTYDGAPLGHLDDDPSAPMRYHDSISWKTFVAPLPTSPNTPKGWLLFSDILLSLPLSLFVRMVSCIKYKIEGLDEYLQHSVRCHYLIRSLPVKLRNALLFARRYIYSIHETIKRLSFIGLLTFGPQRLKEKDQVYLYLHRRLTIKDTTCSQPGYHQISPQTEYAPKEYFLETEEDVHRFWVEVESTCLCTPLGTAQTMRGQVIELQNLYKKPAMIEACRNREFGEEVDAGLIPGDQLGAAGFDSALFAHLKRNWNYTSTVSSKTAGGLVTASHKEKGKSKQLENYIEYLDKTGKETDGGTARKQKQKQRLSKLRATISRMSVYYPKPGAPSTDPVAVPVVINGPVVKKKAPEPAKKKPPFRKRPQSIFRLLKGRITKKDRRPYYDDKDKAALKQMRSMRVAWSTQEDIILLMCKVASWFLDPHQPKMVVPFTAIRDILQEHIPELSKDKTSRACQRRLRFMLMNPATRANASVFLCEARQDQKLTEMFHGPKPVKSAEEEWIRMLRTVLNHLMVKFSKSPQERHLAITLPKTIEDLKDRYNILVSGQCLPDSWSYQEPHNIVDIHFITVAMIIVSSFGADDGKTSWSLTLYRIYELYPDKLIRSVTARLRHNSVICKKKCQAKKQFSSLNMSMLPFTWSTRFRYELQRRFVPEHFISMAQLLTTLLENHTSGEKFSTVDTVDPPHALFLITLVMMNKLNYDIEVPQAIVDFDSKISEDNVNQVKVVTKGTANESLLAGSAVSGSFVGNVSNLHIETSGGNAKASRSFLYMLRQDMSKALEIASLRPQDYVLIKPCKVNFSLTDRDFLAGCTVEEPTDKSYKLKIRNPVYDKLVQEQREVLSPSTCEVLWTAEDIKQAYAEHGRDATEADFGHEVYSLIVNRKELGITFTTLCETFNSKATSTVLRSHLNVLVGCRAIIQTGVTCVRYVALLHSKPWMVRAVKIPKDLRSLATALGEQELARRAKAKKACLTEDEAIDGPATVNTSSKVISETTAEISPISVDGNPPDVSVMEVDEDTPAVSAMEVDESTADNSDLKPGIHAAPFTSIEPVIPEVKVGGPTEPMQEVDNIGKASTHETGGNDNQAALTEPKSTQQTSPGQRPATRGTVFNRTCIEAISRNINMETLEKITYIPRLWKKPDGTLNRPLLHRYMAAVLSFVMDNPGITEECIRTTFSKHIEPCIQTLDVLRMLEMIGCIRRFYLRSGNSKCTLLSKRKAHFFSDVYEINDDVCFEGTMEALVNFAAFTAYFLK